MNGHRRIGLLAASAALAITTIGAGSAFAAAPEQYSWTNGYNLPSIECPTFMAWGEFVINHRLTVYLDGAGNPISDLERIDFVGRFYNPDTQVSVADRGTKRFLDTFTADGRYASTIFTYQRIDKYLGEAGRVILGPQDEETYEQEFIRGVGHEGWNDESIAAICAALAP